MINAGDNGIFGGNNNRIELALLITTATQVCNAVAIRRRTADEWPANNLILNALPSTTRSR
jgi:hypothetical protein